MANPEHLAILEQGLKAWNAWRQSNLNIRPDLSRANLSKSNFVQIDFFETDLSDAKLSEVDLTKANLNKSNLEGANLIRAKLLKANLIDANLKHANFKAAELIMTDLSNADITGAILYGTARDDWMIDGIKCDFAFWDGNGQDRFPKNRDFKPGEFENLYKHLPTIHYFFEHGFTPIDAILMDRVVQAINEKIPEFELKLDSFHSRGQPHAIFTVLHKEVAEEALRQIKAEYEIRIAKLEGERDSLEKCFNQAIEKPRIFFKHFKKIEKGDTYNITWNQVSQDVDLTKLQDELSILKEAVRREAKSSEQYRALAEVSDAETAVKAGKGSKVVEHLKKAGKWAFDVARDIGTDVAAEVIKKSL
jgi:hypothetical protein